MSRLLTALILFVCSPFAAADQVVGEVSTVFHLMGANDKIVVHAFDDPKVGGVSCYLSRAQTGGISGTFGLATDTSDSSVACRQVSETLTFSGPLPKQEEVFTERASIMFKKIHVVRMVDQTRNVLVYLVYSDKLIEGSPKNSVTAVAVIGKQIPVK